MKKLTDQELDSVFKNAVEGYEPAFDPAAWDAMNAKLDQPRPALWKRWIPYALLGLVIFSTGVWVGIYMNEKPTLNQVPARAPTFAMFESRQIGRRYADGIRHVLQSHTALGAPIAHAVTEGSHQASLIRRTLT